MAIFPSPMLYTSMASFAMASLVSAFTPVDAMGSSPFTGRALRSSLGARNDTSGFPSVLPHLPTDCDMALLMNGNVTSTCMDSLKNSPHSVFVDGTCVDDHKRQISDGLNAAVRLAAHSVDFPHTNRDDHGNYAGTYWMGPTWDLYAQRIRGNLGRIASFSESSKAGNTSILISCQSEPVICGQTYETKKVAGFSATTQSGRYGEFYTIVLCDAFFEMPTLDNKTAVVTDGIFHNKTEMAKDIARLSSSGTFFLHELMHTQFADGGIEPRNADLYVNESPVETTERRAFGANAVHELATTGGGAMRATNNANSYVVLANSLFWWDLTGYFTEILVSRTGPNELRDPIEYIQLHLDLGSGTIPPLEDRQRLYKKEFAAMGPAPPPPKPTSTKAPAPTNPCHKPTYPGTICFILYDGVTEDFRLMGRGWEDGNDKIGVNGDGLFDNLKPCGVTAPYWEFIRIPPEKCDPPYDFFAHASMPVGTNYCITRAFRQVGINNTDHCEHIG